MLIQAPNPKITRFSELPRELRTAFHGTNSVLLEGIRKDGLGGARHPLIDEARNCVINLCKKVESETLTLRGNLKRKYQYVPYEKSILLHRLVELGVNLSEGDMYSYPCLATEKRSAELHAGFSPEIVSHQILLDASRIFSKLPGVFGSMFEKDVQGFSAIALELKAVFLKGNPVVLTFEIPSLDYLRGFEGISPEKEAAREAFTFSDLSPPPSFLFNYGNTGYRVCLAKPLEPKYLLNVEVLDQPIDYHGVE